MNEKQMERMHSGKGFIAALDQSGGSTPKALRAYGIQEDAYKNEDEMFDMVHAMRSRIITDSAFRSERILAAILFENTMNRKVEGKYTGDYLWDVKGIVPFLKIDKGLADEENHVKMLKPIPNLGERLDFARDERHIFGTKERSLILDYDEAAIRKVADQQFELAEKVWSHGLVPIVEPEVDIHSPNKAKCEELLHDCFVEHLMALPEDTRLIFKLTIPTEANLYQDLMSDPRVVRVVALSGGYTTEEANRLLSQNHGMIASFSRALAQDLRVSQTDEEFTKTLYGAIESIYEASMK
ncbi:MAG: fructose bisphosphate aldolase [Eubacteriales bacterium]|nr:fructose bisphosphate aldolase [Eubacteriales bacterium]